VPPKTTSWVWKYFRIQEGQVDQKHAFCLICKSWKSWAKGTTNLIYHLQSIHYLSEPAGTDSKQSTLQAMTMVAPPISDGRKRAITRAIGAMIAMDLQPFSLVENPGFRNLMRQLEPRYDVPTRHYFTRTLIPLVYEEKKSDLQGNIE
jgi:hypothetical protein